MLPRGLTACAHPSQANKWGRLYRPGLHARPDCRCDCRPSPRWSSGRVRAARTQVLRRRGVPRTAAGPGCTAAARGARVRVGFSVFGSRVMSSVPQVRQPFVLSVSCPCPPFLPIFQARFGLYAIGFQEFFVYCGASPGLRVSQAGKSRLPTLSRLSLTSTYIFLPTSFSLS